MSRLKYSVPQNILNIIYKSIVSPIIDYGICVYGFTSDSHLRRITRLQNRAARVLTTSDEELHKLFERLNWMSFYNRRNYFNLIFIHKCLNNLSSNQCNGLFKYKTSQRHTRSSDRMELELKKSHLKHFQITIFYNGVKSYNALDLSLKKETNFKKFVNLLKNSFL